MTGPKNESVDDPVGALGLSNATLDDIEVWENLHRNWYVATLMLRLIVACLGVLASLFVTAVILRNRKLRNRVNYYIMNVLLNYALFYISEPLVFGMHFLLKGSVWIEKSLLDDVWPVQVYALLMTRMFATLLALDWYLMRFKKEIIAVYYDWYKFLVCCLYIFGGVKCCAGFAMDYSVYIEDLVTFTTCLVVVTMINFLKCSVRAAEGVNECGIFICNLVVYSWLPLYLYHVMALFFDRESKDLEAFYMYTEIVPYLLVCSTTLIIMCVLGRRNKYYNAVYRNIFSHGCVNVKESDMDCIITDD